MRMLKPDADAATGGDRQAVWPYRLAVPQEQLDDLQSRLARTRWPGRGPRRRLGLRRPADAPTGSGPVLAHGGDPADAVDLVLPHLPGFCLSGPTRDAGWTVARIARAWAELMRRLGYSRYGAQGGDWGHAVSRELGIADREHVIGVHLNTLLTLPPSDPAETAALTEEDTARLRRLAEAEAEMSGYSKIQGTRPQTLAYSLTDAPVGQLAWIAEKFWEWTDPDRREGAVSHDRLLFTRDVRAFFRRLRDPSR